MATPQYDRENTRRINLKLNKKTDDDIIQHLESQENIQGYLKRLIRNDMMKEANNMTYKIKPEYLAQWGEDATEDTVLTMADIEAITRGWDLTPSDIMDQLIPQE